jgi:aspartate/methionine/tyrosine aminotransferase
LIASFTKFAEEQKIALIVDETYRDFLPPGAPHRVFESSWRSNFVHLFSFSKSYCLPGHRLGAIVAAPELLSQVNTVLDCLQICAPRPLQLALPPLLPAMRPFIRETAEAIKARHELFKQILPKKWRIGAQGGYYAFVKHPFIKVNSREVCERLAKQLGVVTLPSSFFYDDTIEGEQDLWDQKRWIRFSVANIDDERVRKVCERLEESETLFGWELDEE